MSCIIRHNKKKSWTYVYGKPLGKSGLGKQGTGRKNFKKGYVFIATNRRSESNDQVDFREEVLEEGEIGGGGSRIKFLINSVSCKAFPAFPTLSERTSVSYGIFFCQVGSRSISSVVDSRVCGISRGAKQHHPPYFLTWEKSVAPPFQDK